MTEQAKLEIADAAIAFISLRIKVEDLKAQRAEVLRSEECSAKTEPDDVDCYRQYRTPAPISAFCLRCQRAFIAHTHYRKAVAQRTGALLKLKRLTSARNGDSSI